MSTKDSWGYLFHCSEAAGISDGITEIKQLLQNPIFNMVGAFAAWQKLVLYSFNKMTSMFDFSKVGFNKFLVFVEDC